MEVANLGDQVAERSGQLCEVALFSGCTKLPTCVDASDHVVELRCGQHTCNGWRGRKRGREER